MLANLQKATSSYFQDQAPSLSFNPEDSVVSCLVSISKVTHQDEDLKLKSLNLAAYNKQLQQLNQHINLHVSILKKRMVYSAYMICIMMVMICLNKNNKRVVLDPTTFDLAQVGWAYLPL